MSAPALCGRLLGSLVRDSANEMARWSDRRSDILWLCEPGAETTGAKTAPQLNHGVITHGRDSTNMINHGVITTYLSMGFQIIKPRLRATEPFAYYQAGPGNFAERDKVRDTIKTTVWQALSTLSDRRCSTVAVRR